MKVIGSTSAWKNDLDHALARLAAIGFKEVDLICIESWGLVSLEKLTDDFESEASRVESLLKKHNLKAVSVNSAFSGPMFEREDAAVMERRKAEVQSLLRFMERLGIRMGAHYPGHISDWKNDPEGVWKDTTATIRDIQEMLTPGGPAIGPELHFKTPYETPDGGRRLRKAIPGLTYTYEPSHYIVNGVDIKGTGDLLEDAAHVHMRGCDTGKLQAPPEVAKDALKWVVSKLKERNYQGMISIEYLPKAEFDSEDAIARTKTMVEGWITSD